MPRVMVIGLDCVPPSLAFDELRESMPNLAALAARGTWGPMRSCIPPITVPAWACMTSGRDPGELGIYGFREKRVGSYELGLVTSEAVREPRVWDRLGDAGKRVAVLFVPPTWPPQDVNGELVSCMLTPGADTPHTSPTALAAELTERFGAYIPDVTTYRGAERDAFLEELETMTSQHFAIARHLWSTRHPDFLMMVEIGPDRLHHALWSRRREDPGFREYYARLDTRLGALVALADEDTAVLVVSDHGARDLVGGVAINEWLAREGWLSIAPPQGDPVPLARAAVDWKSTRAWGEGGYYARIFLNVAGREPEGTVSPADYESTRDALAAALEDLRGPDGSALGVQVVRPDRTFRRVEGTPPDLLVFFGDLAWRSIGSVGYGRVLVEGDDRAPDGCNHDWDGIFVLAGAGVRARGGIEGLSIYDVTPTVLSLAGVPCPKDLLGVDRSNAS